MLDDPACYVVCMFMIFMAQAWGYHALHFNALCVCESVCVCVVMGVGLFQLDCKRKHTCTIQACTVNKAVHTRGDKSNASRHVHKCTLTTVIPAGSAKKTLFNVSLGRSPYNAVLRLKPEGRGGELDGFTQ